MSETENLQLRGHLSDPESAIDAERIAAEIGITQQSANYLIDEAAARFGAREWLDFDDYLRSIRNLHRDLSNTRGT